MRFVLNVMAMAVGVWFATLLPLDIAVTGGEGEWWTRVLVFGAVGVILQLLNQVIKPVLQILALPITILTLGLFALVVNWFVLWLAAWVTTWFGGIELVIGDFWLALVGALVITIISSIVRGITGSARD
ncbi:phage holin family protein [Demequina sp. NBRC 110057]|uniref:phage holin family protein n=1 Tax=Demequina sp. NBRC 110057 TaxID=1570346 RepID=UPI0009FC742C|nr:phage holin family protein [Demequina sp. NBRC 110057]